MLFYLAEAIHGNNNKFAILKIRPNVMKIKIEFEIKIEHLN